VDYYRPYLAKESVLMCLFLELVHLNIELPKCIPKFDYLSILGLLLTQPIDL
jgi:hypothetical protein